jgi:anthranilate phosphoribosyltransferase
MTLADALKKVVGGAALTGPEMTSAFEEIVEGKASDARIAAFAIALRMRGEHPGEIAAAAAVMRARAIHVKVGARDFVDTCGTGGDGAGTFNVSTTAAFVVAACGLPVAKHGNRGVSSASGSADVLRELGLDVDAPVAAVEEAISVVGIGFLFAPLYHGALKAAANARKEVGVRTFFNLLGPLANPARAPFQVMGIYDGALLETVAKALQALGTRGALVVHGDDGLDEITLTTTTRIARVDARSVQVERFDPTALGLARCRKDDLKGGDPKENAAITRAILAGERSPRRDAVALNAAAALVAAGRQDWKGALAAAQQAIDSGAAKKRLDDLIRVTAEAATAARSAG